ncbi:MAG: glucose 1-dehydrogenase [Pseudolabrys sp.]|jgi:NAD(P)-dependent dehydrogenase (short-subunit alcohol dehydrogenase family)
MHRFSLAERVAVITGGAGGLGSAIAAGFAEAGAAVVVADLTVEPCESVAAKIVESGGNAVGYALDVTIDDAVETAFADIARKFGRIDILVNSAGIARRAPALEQSRSDWEQVMAVNTTGVFLSCRAAARQMMKNGGGSMVNMASIMGLSGGGLYPNISYQTSKGAVVNMTRSLALEWAADSIRVNAIAPTWVRTDFIKAIVNDPNLLTRVEQMIPLGRLAEPDDIVGAALFLASPASAMVTGHILAVDGGFLAQ